MAAPDMTLSRLGQQNATGDADALFLKVFSGMVLTAFSETNVMRSRHMVRSIPNGKSAQFPATWKGSARYHVPGTFITGTAVKHNERIITIDDLLLADRAIAEIDEAKNHYDVRSIYAQDIGSALARQFDQNVFRVGVLTARASATVQGGNGGTVLYGVSATDSDDLEGAAFAAAQAMDEKDVPPTERYLGLSPASFYALLQGSDKVINLDYNPTPNGGFAAGTMNQLAGMEIVKSNNVPNDDDSANTNIPAAYRADFDHTSGLAWHRSAMGTVNLIGLAMETWWEPLVQSYIMLGKYALGHGILRPESAVELSSRVSAVTE